VCYDYGASYATPCTAYAISDSYVVFQILCPPDSDNLYFFYVAVFWVVMPCSDVVGH